jgi:EAL domain-containing protein (putative c-di-GMP-specific phosphodiesterase class I)
MFNDPPSSNNIDDQSLAEQLRAAIVDRVQLELLYQPAADAHSGEINSVEALIRWRHPEMGLLSPAHFLPLAERFGMLSMLTDRVLQVALDQLSVWCGRGLMMTITVNLFDDDLRRPELVDHLASAMVARDVPTNLLELEVSEPAVLAHDATHGKVLAAMRRAGMRVSIQDFGTGCATLMRMHDLPADSVKLSRALVSRVLEDPITEQVVSSLVNVAHAAHLRVTAEGVENGELWEHLGDLGCDRIQGHRLAPALSAETVTNMMLGVTLAAS